MVTYLTMYSSFFWKKQKKQTPLLLNGLQPQSVLQWYEWVSEWGCSGLQLPIATQPPLSHLTQISGRLMSPQCEPEVKVLLEGSTLHCCCASFGLNAAESGCFLSPRTGGSPAGKRRLRPAASPQLSGDTACPSWTAARRSKARRNVQDEEFEVVDSSSGPAGSRRSRRRALGSDQPTRRHLSAEPWDERCPPPPRWTVSFFCLWFYLQLSTEGYCSILPGAWLFFTSELSLSQIIRFDCGCGSKPRRGRFILLGNLLLCQSFIQLDYLCLDATVWVVGQGCVIFLHRRDKQQKQGDYPGWGRG